MILLRARLMKRSAEQSSLVNTSAKARACSAGIEDRCGSGGYITSNEDAGRGARDSGTTGSVEAGVDDGNIGVQQAHDAGRASDKRALCGVLQSLVELGNEEDGVFRNIIMFI